MNNVAIIGTGYGERVLKKCIEYSKNYHLKYILSRKKKGTLFISNIKKIIKDKTLKLICIETPPFTHRQQLKPDAFIRNGSIYAAKRNMIIKKKRYGTKNSIPYIMSSMNSINIDEKKDLELFKILLKKK